MLMTIELKPFHELPGRDDIQYGLVPVVRKDGRVINFWYTTRYGWNTRMDIGQGGLEHGVTPDQMSGEYAGWIPARASARLEESVSDRLGVQPDWQQVLGDLLKAANEEFEMNMDRYNSMSLFSLTTAAGDEIAEHMSMLKDLIPKLKEALEAAREREL